MLLFDGGRQWQWQRECDNNQHDYSVRLFDKIKQKPLKYIIFR